VATPQGQIGSSLDDRALYEQICRSHAGIAEFRAKLLALIPLASGAGVFTVLGKFTAGHGQKLLAPIGLLGFAFALGLFVYELRGIEDCTMLRDRARKIEETHGIDPLHGHFMKWPPGRFDVLDEVGAGWIVYTAVLAGWAFVAVRGFAVLSDRERVIAALCIFAYLGLLAIAVSMHLGRRLWHYRDLSATGRILRFKRIMGTDAPPDATEPSAPVPPQASA